MNTNQKINNPPTVSKDDAVNEFNMLQQEMNKNNEMLEKIEELKGINKKIDDGKKSALIKEASIKEKDTKLITLGREAGKTKEQILELGFDETLVGEIFNNKDKDENTFKESEKINGAKESLNAVFDEKEEEARLNQRMKEIGLSDYDFSKMPEWATFSHGQKMLILEQAAQETLSDVKETGKERFEQKNKISFKEFNPSSFAKKIWRNVAKPYYINKEEKKAVLEAAQGKLMPEEEILKSLVARMADMDLPVTEKNGKAIIEFEAINKNLSPEQQEIVNNYNKIANEYARMPDSWKNEKAAKNTDAFTKNNYSKYQQAKEKYEQVRSELIEMRTNQYKEEGNPFNDNIQGEKINDLIKNVMDGVKDNDLRIAMLQFTNTHPDAVGELKKIHDMSAFKKIFRDSETVWRGLYMGTGFAARSITASTLGLVAAPLVAGVIGGARARRKANQKINEAFSEGREMETFKQRKEAGKEGLYDDKNVGKKGLVTNIMPGMTGVNAKEVAGFVDADSQMQRITNLMSKIENAATPMEKAEAMRQLTARIDYIEQKKNEGLINFGTDNPIGLNYAFLKLLSEAEIKSQVMDENDPLDLTPEQIQALYEQGDRRASLTEFVKNYNEAQREFEQTYFKNTETARGVLVGAGFSLLGWKIRDWVHGSHHGVEGLSASTTKSILGNQDNLNATDDFINKTNVIDTSHAQAIHDTAQVIKTPTPDSVLSKINVDTTQQHIADSSKLVTPVTPTITPVPGNTPDVVSGSHKAIDAFVHKGKGAITTIQELQKNLREEYGNDLSKAPTSVQHILNTKADKLAIEYGMFKPGANVVDESALTKVGGKFNVDESGNVTYQESSGSSSTLLEKGTEIKASGTYEGKMFDSDHGRDMANNPQGNFKDDSVYSNKKLSNEYDEGEEYLKNNPEARLQALKGLEINSSQVTPSDIKISQEELEYDKLNPKTGEILMDNQLIDKESLEAGRVYPNTASNINSIDDQLVAIKPPVDNIQANPATDLDNKDMSSRGGPSINNNTPVNTESTRSYNTGGVKNIYPTGEGGNINKPPVSNDGFNNGFTKEIPMTKNVSGVESSPSDAIEIRSTTHGLNFENDPRHLASAREVNQQFGNENVVIDRSGGRTINGIDNTYWNRAADKMFENKVEAGEIKFDNYAQYDKELELQRLFGHGEQGIEYDASLDKNIETTRMTEYFRDTDEWSTVSKIPARDFFDFNRAINAGEVSQPDLNKLLNTGVVKDTIDIDGNHDYSFVHENELKRLSGFYGEFDRLNARPLGDETIEKYVARLTRTVHQTKNGVYYIVKDNAPINDKMLDDGIIERRAPRFNRSTNYSARHNYNDRNYSRRVKGLTSKALSPIWRSQGWTTPVRMTDF